MHTFEPKPKPGHESRFAHSTMPRLDRFRHGREAHPILFLQRTIGNQAVARMLEASTVDTTKAGTGGIAGFGHEFSSIPVRASAGLGSVPTRAPSEQSIGAKPASVVAALARASEDAGHLVPQVLRSRIEMATGADLGAVRIHTAAASQQAALMLNARAFTIGGNIHFAPGQYRPGNQEGDRLIAHELVHTIQQGPGVATPNQPSLEVSKPGDVAEVEADTIADAIMGHKGGIGTPAAMHVSAARKAISRAEFKNGDATFKVDPYAEADSDNGNDTARQVGVSIDVTYKSAETYKSDKIAFVQTMKTTKDGAPYLFENEKARATTAKEGEAGWAIDRLSGMKSPIYAQENTGSAGGNTIFGHRKSKTDFKDAWMHDAIGLNRAVGQKVTVDAVTFAFDETNSKYLGGVSWGFATDAKGKTKKKDAALQSAGDPGGIQKEALKKWNEQAALTDATKKNAPDQQKVVVP